MGMTLRALVLIACLAACGSPAPQAPQPEKPRQTRPDNSCELTPYGTCACSWLKPWTCF